MVPDEKKENSEQDGSNCGPHVVMARTYGQDAMTFTHQCPHPPRDHNNTATFVFDIKTDETVTFALVNKQKHDVKSTFNLTCEYLLL